MIQDLVTSFRKPYQDEEEFEVNLMPSSAITIFEHVHQHAQFYTLVVKSEASSNFQRMIWAGSSGSGLTGSEPYLPSTHQP